ncbi:uncharacterized protein RSE6_15160 [Rhynchosporium secalis]|uniref:Uncharacterized protein n=1 Tax=Rhynchosporium secalis TaxID=38038 RepID=A0A1E1MWS3_RHYSE|nr:uncharacterized protein RSE6_15160 [Rhynchosporium secalis]
MSKSTTTPRPQAPGPRSHTRLVVEDAARAWNITPPPDEAQQDANFNEDTLVFSSRCLLQVHEKVDAVRQDLLNLHSYQRYGDDVGTSPLSQTSLDGRLDAVEERTEALEQQSKEDAELHELLSNIKDELGDKIETLGSDFSDLDARMETELTGLHAELSDLDGRMETGFTELNTRLDIVSNAVQVQRNSMATRFYSTVHPLTISAGARGGVQQGVAGKTVKWYWRCHHQKNIERLVDLLTFYSIDFKNWYYTYSDTDSDDDSTDLNHPQSEPSSIREAAQLQTQRAVMALFSHLGLPYHVFEEQIKRPQVMFAERKRGKNDEVLEMKGKKSKQRYVGKDGVSFSGSPTDINTSPTQSAASG